MSFIINITDALLNRDFFKSEERKADQQKNYDILDSGTVSVDDASLKKRFESIDEKLLTAVIEKSNKIKEDLEKQEG